MKEKKRSSILQNSIVLKSLCSRRSVISNNLKFFVVLALSLCTIPCFASCPSMDATGDCRVDFEDFALLADQWLGNDFTSISVLADQWLTEGLPEPVGIVWVSINDQGFTGEMNKYETTSAQYCQFLNAALASGDIAVSGNNVYGASGSNSGADFAGQLYYNLVGPGYTYNGAANGGAARIHYSDGVFTVDSGFENHPVTYVSWYGATAFCNYYAYRLPTYWEWQAVADYHGDYGYGCGLNINNGIANYYDSIHPDGTTAIGMFGAYGYGMCDMAGNVYEWTSTGTGEGDYYVRSSRWSDSGAFCSVGNWNYFAPYFRDWPVGFRICR